MTPGIPEYSQNCFEQALSVCEVQCAKPNARLWKDSWEQCHPRPDTSQVPQRVQHRGVYVLCETQVCQSSTC